MHDSSPTYTRLHLMHIISKASLADLNNILTLIKMERVCYSLSDYAALQISITRRLVELRRTRSWELFSEL